MMIVWPLLVVIVASIQHAQGSFGPTVAPLKCKAGWKQFKGQCIKEFNDSKRSWDGARLACKDKGGDLVTIDSSEKQNWISRTLFHNKGRTDVWIGLKYMGLKEDFKWVNDKKLTYRNWARNMPDAAGGVRGQDCIQMWQRDDRWDDTGCTDKKDYICEKPIFGCPPGWSHMPNTSSCFKPFHEPKTWEGAKASCNAQGWSLVRITDHQQDDFVSDELDNGKAYWIGAILNQKNELLDVLDDVDLVKEFSNWMNGEPNGRGNECVEIYNDRPSGWNDHTCSVKRNYICQQDLNAKALKARECPEGFSLIDGKCLMFNKRKYGYKQAERFCNNLGGNLADITSKEMGETLKTQTKKRGNWWTGAHTSQRLNATIFQSGKRVNETYSNWASDQPTDGKPCVEVVARSAQWISQRCNKRNRFVCQVPSLKEFQVKGQCSDGWIQVGTSCIKNTKQVVSWAKGKALCDKQNAELLEIYDASFSTIIKRFMKPSDRIWLGANNDHAPTFDFRWNSGRKMVHSNWYQHISPRPSRNSKRCVDFNTQGYWDDISCDVERLVFCETYGSIPNNNCPDMHTWTFFNGVCYKMFKDRVDAYVASSKCEEFGGRLANLKNLAIFNLVLKMLHGKKINYSWIGANDKETDGEFKWSDGTPVQFSRWLLNRDIYLKQPKAECSAMSSRGKWYSNRCTGGWLTSYVCEYDGK